MHLELMQQLKAQDKFIIGYTGAMGPPNALEYLLEAMLLIKATHPHIHCVLLGHGQNLQQLQNYCQIHQLHHVHFLPRVSKPVIPEFLDLVDTVYLGWQNTPLYQYGVSPNKLFDYMLAAKPIIESGGAPMSLVTQAECGFQTQAASSEKIANTLIKMSELTQEQRIILGNNGKNFVLKHHTYPILAAQFLKILS